MMLGIFIYALSEGKIPRKYAEIAQPSIFSCWKHVSASYNNSDFFILMASTSSAYKRLKMFDVQAIHTVLDTSEHSKSDSDEEVSDQSLDESAVTSSNDEEEVNSL